MSTLRAYFDQEAADYLGRLATLVRDDAAINGGELQRLARGLRGTANLAREDHVYRAALGFESAARAVAQQSAPWDDDTRGRLSASLADLSALATTLEADDERETRVSAVLERCLPLAEAAPAATALSRSTAERIERERHQFRDYVAREAAGIAQVLDESMAAFTRNPMNREPLGAVLRRHRALLGAARLDDVKIVAETLRAVEDLSGVITRLNAPVKKEWFDVFRCARDVLRGAADALNRGEDPRASTALSRLRTLHEELLDRYGSGEPMVTAPIDAREIVPPLDSDTGIADLCYRGPAALQRALELRSRVEAALRDEPAAREVVDELFDLIRLGLE